MHEELFSGEPVSVKCFTFYNPDSINGPFGNFQLWIGATDVSGRMTSQILFGLGATMTLNLSGQRSGTNPIVCTLDGEGIVSGIGQPTVSVEQPVSITFASDWSTGQLDFSASPSGSGLPVTLVAC